MFLNPNWSNQNFALYGIIIVFGHKALFKIVCILQKPFVEYAIKYRHACCLQYRPCKMKSSSENTLVKLSNLLSECQVVISYTVSSLKSFHEPNCNINIVFNKSELLKMLCLPKMPWMLIFFQVCF